MPTSRPVFEAILHAIEQDPGHWHMHAGSDADETPYACIRLLEVDVRDLGRLKRYRVVTWMPASADRRLVGYYDELRRACEAARRRRQHEATGSDPWMRNHTLATAYGDSAELTRRHATKPD